MKYNNRRRNYDLKDAKAHTKQKLHSKIRGKRAVNKNY